MTPAAPRPTHLGRRRVFDYTTKKLLSPTTKRGARLLGLYTSIDDLEDLIVVQDAIGDLPDAGDDNRPLPYGDRVASYSASLRDSAVHNHRLWRHRSEMLRRLRAVPEGGGLLDKYGRARSRPYFSQAYTRLHRQSLARTITTNFHNPGSGRFLHYEALRTLTVREAARLQWIEGGFVLSGSSPFKSDWSATPFRRLLHPQGRIASPVRRWP